MPKVSDYTAITTPADTDVYYVIQGGVSKKVTWATIKAAVIGQAEALTYKGAINCSANPNYPAADAGHIYIVSVAGKIGGASGTAVTAGDMIVCNTDGTVAGTQAAVGSKWNIVQSNIDLSSITITGGTIDGATIGATMAGTVRSLLDEDAEIVTADATLTANQCSGGLISNYNQSLDCTVTVPTAFAGGNFIVALSTAVAKYYRLDPTGSEVWVWDGVAQTGGKYIGIAAATVGAALQFIAIQTGAAAYTWHVYTVAGGWVSE